MKKHSLAVLIGCLLSSYVFAADDNLPQLLNERNIEGIQSIIQEQPDNGEAYYYASIYYGIGDDDLGTHKDDNKKIESLKKSAELGYSEGQLQYGFHLLNTGDATHGIQYIESAASQDNIGALSLLGDLYFAGYQDKDGKNVVEPDINKAIELLEKAADAGSQDARYTLGYIYLDESLGHQDIDKALTLFESNIDYDKKTGHISSIIALLDLYDEGQLVTKNKGKSLDYYYLASLQGYAPTFYAIGMIQRAGDKGERLDIPKDPEAAFENLRKAVQAGHIDAMFRIGEMYFKGEGTQQSDMNAYIWIALAEDLTSNQTNYSETILELIPKRQRQIAVDNKNHLEQFFKVIEDPSVASHPNESNASK